jgi:hypothetical protein
MPVATPIAESLAARPLPAVVAAVAAIAATLTRLQDEFDIAHRNIKPGNLYELDGEWLIGDFGLIAVPGAESLTTDGRQVGPANYTAWVPSRNRPGRPMMPTRTGALIFANAGSDRASCSGSACR